MDLDMEKLAKQFEELADIVVAISGTFRSAASGSKTTDGDGKAAKPVRGAKKQPVTEDDCREALKELAAAKGKEKMAEALAVVGAGRLPDVDESQYQELIDAARRMIDEPDEPTPAKTRKTRKPKGPTYASVEAKFKELVAADKKAAKAVLAEAELTKLSEVDEDDADTLKVLDAAIDAALAGDEEEDDDLV